MLHLHDLRGAFVVLDGPDGSGKTTVLPQLAESLRSHGLTVTTCKDPGGTRIGDRIRSVILDHDLTDMDVACETLLFMASRAQLVAEVVRPALARGDVVLCDRFVSATCAYQVAAGYELKAVVDLAEHAIGSTWPDLTLILDVPVELGLARVRQRLRVGGGSARPAGLDSMEARPVAFHEAVRGEFQRLSGRYPGPVAVIDAREPVDVVVQQALSHLERLGARNAQSAADHARRASA